MDEFQPFVIRINDAGRIAQISDSTAGLLETAKEDLVGVPSLKIVHAPDVNSVREAYWHAVQKPSTRSTTAARLNTGSGVLVAADLVLMNLGSQAAPDMLVEVRPQLPAPPPQAHDDGEQAQHANFHQLEIVDGLAHIQKFLDLGANDFMVLMIAINDVGDHLDELVEELGNRLQSTIRGTDRLFRKTHNHFMLVAAGLQDQSEIGIVLDRLRACLSFPFTIEGGATVVPSGSIGVALPAHAPTPEYMMHCAETQLRLAAVQDGEFPYAVERRARPRV